MSEGDDKTQVEPEPELEPETESEAAADADEENGLALDEDESQQLQEVFSTIFPQYLIPLEELVGQLLEGENSPEIIEGLRGALAPLASAAASIGVTRLKGLLEEFQQVVERVADGGQLDKEHREDIIDVFYRLKEAVQAISGDEKEPQEREKAPSDFVARLSAIEGVEPADVQKVVAAGITSEDLVAGATVDEIAAVTGMGDALAQRIHSTFGGRVPTSRLKAQRREPTRSMAAPAPPPREVDTRPSELLQGRMALVGVVRDRVRLAESLEREAEAAQKAHRQAEEALQRAAVLRARVLQTQEELLYERGRISSQAERLKKLQADIIEEKEATARMVGRTETGGLDELQSRLEEMQQRVAKRMRRG